MKKDQIYADPIESSFLADGQNALNAVNSFEILKKRLQAGVDLQITKDYHLFRDSQDGALKLKKTGTFRPKEHLAAISVDFSSLSKMQRWMSRATPPPIEKGILASALGIKGNTRPWVVDATCGLAQDSLRMLQWGVKVWAFERCPIVALLVEDAVERAKKNPLIEEFLQQNFRFFHRDSTCNLDQLPTKPDVIYLDPMYQEWQGRRLSCKEMRILHDIVPLSSEKDDLDLLRIALEKAGRRVVVKRALSAPTLGPSPTLSFKGKSTRYDVYLVNP